jgi:hypothetical protein
VEKGASFMLRTLSVTAVMLMAAPAMTQNPPPAPRTNPTVQVAPPSAAAPPEKIAPPSQGDMSNRLSQQRGTIDPPNVDPKMTVHPPAQTGGTTPVIPPPGSPGGNPSVVPK